jgi:hypothetical protein
VSRIHQKIFAVGLAAAFCFVQASENNEKITFIFHVASVIFMDIVLHRDS